MNYSQINETEEERQVAANNPQLFTPVPEPRQKVTISTDDNVHPNHGETSILDDLATVPTGAHSVADSHATLTQSVVEQLKLNNPVEAKRPEWKYFGRDEYVAFRSNFLEYTKKGGCKSLAELLSNDAYNSLTFYLNITDLRATYPASGNNTLLALIDAHFKLDSAAELHVLLSKVKMSNKSDKGDPAAVEKYVGAWMTVFYDHSVIRAADAHSSMVAKAVLAGLQPEVFRETVKARDPQCFKDIMLYIREALDKLRVVLAYDETQQRIEKRQGKFQKNKTASAKTTGASASTTDPGTHERVNVGRAAVATASKPTANPSTANAATAAPAGVACSNCALWGMQRNDHVVADCPVTCFQCANLAPPRDHQRKHCKPVKKQANHVRSAAASASSDATNIDDSVSNDILVDSGANGTYVHNPAYISQLTSSVDRTRTIKVADGSSVPIEGQGLLVDIPCDYVPTFDHSLIGVSAICSNNNICLFDQQQMTAINTTSPVVTEQYNQLLETARATNSVSMTAHNDEGVYKTNYPELLQHRCSSNCPEIRGTTACAASAPLWANSVIRYASQEFKTLQELVQYFHEAWNHASKETMIQAVQRETFRGLPAELTPAALRKHYPLCAACHTASMSRKPLPRESVTSYGIGEVWEVDAKGPITGADGKVHESFSGNKYVISCMDLQSRYVHCFFAKNLSTPNQYIKKLINIVKNQKRSIKIIRTDDAFLTENIKELCAAHQITLESCAPYEHGQIGHIERFHRTINESVVKALHGKPHLQDKYWAMAWTDCVDKLNMLPHAALDGQSPQHLWSGHTYDLRNTPLLPFGTVVLAHYPVETQHALGGRAFETFSVGIAPGYKGGILLFNPETKKYIVRRTFKPLGPKAPVSTTYKLPIEYDTEFVDVPVSSDDRFNPDNHDLTAAPVDSLHTAARPSAPTAASKTTSKSRVTAAHVPDLLRNVNTKQAKVARVTLLADIPKTWKEAMESKYKAEWIAALLEEIGRWNTMRTHEAVASDKVADIHRSMLVNSSMVFDIKRDSEGKPVRFKIRIVARGDQYLRNHRLYDVLDSNDNPVNYYAGTVKTESVKILLAIAAELDLELTTWDVATAFLYPALKPDEEIYLRRPKGLTDEHMPLVMKLNKCVYGLPQASKYFREHSDKALQDIGFKPTISDPQVYTYREGHDFIYISTHVDDFGVISNSLTLMASVKAKLDTVYNMKVTDSSSYLGLHIERDRAKRVIWLSQPKYIVDVLERFNVRTGLTTFPATPMNMDFNWKPTIDSPIEERGVLCEAKRKLYMQKIGSLVYLTIMTRPDILFATNILSRFCKQPTQRHMEAVDRVLQFIAGTADYKYTLHSGEGIVLYATTDASYACHKDLKSHTGCTLHIGRHSASVHSVSKKQSITADSSTVAEFIAAHTCAKEIMWARNFLEELGFKQHNSTVLFEDNQPAIKLMTNSNSGFKTKHIALRYNFLREQITKGLIDVRYLPSARMNADQLTKPFEPSKLAMSKALILGSICSADREKNAKN